MSAAVADATPANAAEEKIEKSNYLKIDLVPTVDILRELGADKGVRILIGFAAQAGKDAQAKALTKYLEKNLDFLYFNDVSGGAIFGEEATTGEIVGMRPESAAAVVLESVSGITKVTLANKLFDLAATKLGLSHD